MLFRSINSSLCYYNKVKLFSSMSLLGHKPLLSHDNTTCFHYFSTSTKVNVTGPLKSMMKPFYLKCHPDVQSSDVAKEVNLAALKTINSLMDTLEATCNGKVVDWPLTLEVEFLVPVSDPKIKKLEMTSRRNVVLVLPPKSFRDTLLRSTGSKKELIIESMQRKIQLEFVKILKIASLPAPDIIDYGINEGSNDNHSWLLDELGLDANEDFNPLKPKQESNFGGHQRFNDDPPPERPTTQWEQSRERYTSSIDHKKLNQMYQEALFEMQADIATYGYLKDPRRRHEFLNRLLARVQLDKDATQIDMMEQLVCFRRLSLIFNDNFEDLKFEEMGKMWEELTIILTDPRTFNISKRKKKSGESGFRFTYSADNKVTIHVPIDFQDNELISELKQNLQDFAELFGDSFEEIMKKCRKN